MKRIYLIITLAVLTIVSINIYFFFNFRRNIIAYQKSLIAEQVMHCGSQVEKTISGYENDLTRILFTNSQQIPEIFNNGKVFRAVSSDLQDLYSKNRELISNISVYDNKNNYLGIYLKDNDDIVIDTFPRQSENELKNKDVIIKNKGYYLSYFTFFKNNELTGNIVVEINLEKYLNSVFSLFRLQGLQWQWVANSSKQILMCNYPDSISIGDIEKISQAIDTEEEVVLEHYYSDSQGSNRLIISAIYPLNVLNNDLGIVFTIEAGELNKTFLRQNLFLITGSLFIMILVVGWLLYSFRLQKKKQDKRSADLLSLKMIVEHFPVGIMIIDSVGTIKNINRTGQKMLFLEKDEDITGSNFASQFLVSNKYLLKDGITASFDSNHFMHYEKDGNEIVIYRKDIKAQIAGEELTISALIDVSPLEKSRKQEAAANSAKSDFLAKMSHEIRTPMNGIIGMTENLLRGNLTKSQQEQVMIIKRSSDLLLNIINDILDFSKIEAGKMMLEEIPFNLTEEVGFTLDLFRSLAEEKGIQLVTDIRPEVPDLLIGDPLRLRQVLSNLINNAIKFTHEGKIIIGVRLVENFNATLNILFFVEDTGIGISRENLGKIFANYEQGKNSVSRKYGGTGLGMAISKQLVELMNGQIWVESPSSISTSSKFPGSKFSFTIEVYSNEMAKKKFDFSHIRKFQQISALIFTKEKDESDTIHSLLDRFGINYTYRTYEENSIDSAIYHLEQKKDFYHLVIIIDKEGVDGFLVAQYLKESKLFELFPIIMISSNDQQGNYVRSRITGVDYYLIQPYESNEVFNIIRENFPALDDIKGISPQVNKIRTGIKILIAEDNLINQRVTQSIFKHLGYEIDIARNGIEAVKMVSESNYDIVFMDILMPEMDGLSACSEIRKKGIKIPIIAITASDDANRKAEALASGMNDFITKPIKLESIKQLLIKWFSEKI
ncbi:MAG: response regulator [Bacteroidales bacterium]|nr:response regulator [Bacteroidales bacterium]MCB9000112.1 response regulator [Bacteroidales bacterium]